MRYLLFGVFVLWLLTEIVQVWVRCIGQSHC